MGLKDLAKVIFPPQPDDAESDYVDDLYTPDDEAVYDEGERTTGSVRPVEGGAFPSRGTANVAMVSGSSIEMKVVTPKSYDVVTQIADLLLSNKTVLLNLENTNRETARRLIDFLSGVAYALNGDVQKVADNTYAITPSNVAVSSESVGKMQVPVSDETDSGSAL